MSEHHIPSAKFLWGVAGVLFFLTFLTVAVTWIQFPEPWNIITAVTIAVIKSTIVGMFFMHLWWETSFNVLLLTMGILFFIILVGITLLDVLYRTDPVPGF